MKSPLAAVILSSLALGASASTTFDNITNLWVTAQHTNALAIAHQRLAANPDDVAGCLIQASYDFIYADATTQSNSLDRVLAVYGNITTPEYLSSCFLLEADIAGIKLWLGRETPAQHAEMIQKGSGPGLLPHYFRQLKALDDDGYFNNN